MPVSRPFDLRSIDHVLLLVKGMDDAVGFYAGVLGAVVKSRLPQYAMAELRVGASQIDLVDIDATEGKWASPPVFGGRNVDHIAIDVGRIDEAAVREYLAAHDVAIVEERRDSDADGRTLSLYVRDPSGNTIELFGRLAVAVP